MAKQKRAVPKKSAPTATNRKARFEYSVEETIEAGIMLLGTEVKSLRAGRVNIADAYASVKGGELWLWNAHIQEWSHGNRNNHEPTRARKLLVSARQLSKLTGLLKVRGTTLVPLKLYFNDRGYAKVLLGVAHGKTQYDKRQTIKDRDWKRDQGRLMKKQ
jgi:SsrA-binding protein